jgi:sugar transferase (PEP-CTERM/EpsH1 system associated)
MKPLLFLCHRLPYPPDKGDKIRSFHVLEALRSRFAVHLGTFVDAEEDWAHVDLLRARTASLCVRPLSRRRATLRSFTGLLTGEALTLPFYRDAGLKLWVHQLLRTEPRMCGALVYSSGMAQYVSDEPLPVKVMDFCDLDSDKWAQYARSRGWPARWLYAREARKLARAEGDIARAFDHSLFVSELESALFRERQADLAGRVATLGNGVDTDYFDPARSPARETTGRPHLVFTGAMDYWANIDAVRWFVDECWPVLRQRHPQAQFSIVGSKPSAEVQQLALRDGVCVTGRVPDVRPWLSAADVVVAPLRIARGVQNKVLEAMAMARPVAATSAALQGLGAVTAPEVASGDTAGEFAQAVEHLLMRARQGADASANRDFVIARFGWEATLRPLWPLLERAA